jgi:hypothetical protein
MFKGYKHPDKVSSACLKGGNIQIKIPSLIWHHFRLTTPPPTTLWLNHVLKSVFLHLLRLQTPQLNSFSMFKSRTYWDKKIPPWYCTHPHYDLTMSIIQFPISSRIMFKGYNTSNNIPVRCSKEGNVLIKIPSLLSLSPSLNVFASSLDRGRANLVPSPMVRG